MTTQRRSIHPDRRHELRTTAQRVIVRCLPGERAGQPSPRDLARMRTADSGDAPELWTEANARVLEAMIIARTRLDDGAGAVELVETHLVDGALRVRAVLGLDTLASLFAAVAEAYAAAGRPRDAGVYAARAAVFADSDAVRYRAMAVQALLFALNGELDAADESTAACAEIARDNGWSPLDADYDLVLADVLVGAATLDGERLQRAARMLRTIAPRDPYAQHAAAVADAIGRLAVGEIAGGMAALRTAVSGARSHLSHRMVRELALAALAEVTVLRGGARRGLLLLEGHEPDAGHTVCFHVQRAGALLALGEDRAVLAETDGCIALGVDHCPRTLGAVLTRRAVAHARLGQVDAADDLFVEACALIIEAGESILPFVAVPRDVLDELFDRLAGRLPARADRIAALRQRLRERAPASAPASLPTLTEREACVAAALRGDQTNAEIAASFVVSVNTVKSQLRSLFAKLGVSTRDEAVAVLERHGFYL